MKSLLNNTDFFSQYGLLIVLIVALVVLMFISFNRRKKEDAYRNDLVSKIVPGAMVKTYYGLYGKVLKVTETTDGKILLIESGDDDKISYQNVHVNAVYAIDDKKVVTTDAEGNVVEPDTKSEAELKFEELEKMLAEKEAAAKQAEEAKTEEKVEEPIEEVEVKEEVKAEPKKSTTTKKSTAKKTTTKKSAKSDKE